MYIFRQKTNFTYDFIKFEPDNEHIPRDYLSVDKIRSFVNDVKSEKLTFETDGQVDVELVVHESDYKEEPEKEEKLEKKVDL